MKKMILALILICGLMLTGCNMSMGLGNFSYNHVHITDNIDGRCATVEKWYDNESGIEVKTTEYGSLFLSEGTYILVGETHKCPYCN